jgi:hypothetical protein
MAAALPDFQLASEIGPSPSEADQLREQCSRQAEQIERLQELVTEAQPADKQPKGAIIKPEEKQALVQLLSDLAKQVEDLERLTARQAKEIQDLKKSKAEAEEDIRQIREYFPKLVAEDRARLTMLEACPDISQNETVKDHITALYNHMEVIGRKQVSFREASKCLKLSKSRVLQFRKAIAVDERFIIVHSESHKQKSLIRLRKYFDGNDMVQPPN